jgi:hypothetical protein
VSFLRGSMTSAAAVMVHIHGQSVGAVALRKMRPMAQLVGPGPTAPYAPVPSSGELTCRGSFSVLARRPVIGGLAPLGPRRRQERPAATRGEGRAQ